MYQPKNDQVFGRQLKVQSVAIPFKIVGHATPASVAITRDEPSLLFLKTEGVNQITAALDSADTGPTYASATDSTGVFNILLKIGEPLAKVISARIVSRTTTEVIACTLTSTPADGIVAGGSLDKICLNADSSANLTSATLDACLCVDYVVAE